MKTWTLTLSFILLISPARPNMLPAQGVPQTTIGTWESVKSVPPGDELDVKLKNNRTIDGRLSSVSDTALTLSHKKGVTTVDRADVHHIRRVVPKSAARAALIGAGVGAAAGAGLAGVALAADDTGGNTGEAVAIVVVIGLVGTAIGALIGAGAGLRKKKVLIYEAR